MQIIPMEINIPLLQYARRHINQILIFYLYYNKTKCKLNWFFVKTLKDIDHMFLTNPALNGVEVFDRDANTIFRKWYNLKLKVIKQTKDLPRNSTLAQHRDQPIGAWKEGVTNGTLDDQASDLLRADMKAERRKFKQILNVITGAEIEYWYCRTPMNG